MSKLTVQLLGPPQVELSGQPISVDTRKAIALIAYLAATNQIQQRTVLAALLWPESDESRARSALRRTLATLNRAIDGPWLEATRKTIQLVPHPALEVDVIQVRSLLAECRKAKNDCERRIPLLEKAISLFRGVFLEGFTLQDSAEFDEWQRIEEETWQRELSWALKEVIACHQQAGNYETAVKHGRHWLSLDNLHEPAHQALMRVYALSGQRSAAIRQYETCQGLLAEELGIDPQSETTALYKQILSGELEKETAAPPQTPTLEPTALPHPAAPPGNLPSQSTSFVGREKELAEILELLDDSNNRLISVIGPGGIGKTRLSLEVGARRNGNYAHGVFFVPIGPVSAVDYLVPTIADAIGFTFFPGSGADPRVPLLNYLRDKEMFLILDNFEHVMDGVDLVSEILQKSPHIQILVTSQERLNLAEEWLVEIYGLECPKDLEDIESCSAVKLFTERASQVNKAFALKVDEKPQIARICHLVGGMPLGIELASTWTRILSCQAIADQIEESMDFLASNVRNIPARHRSIRAVFEHSWRLLEEDERVAFRKLSVFRGGFSAEAAGRVTGASLRTLLALTNKSLLASNQNGRFEIQEVLHQYAHEKFQADFPEEAQQEVEARHSAFYLDFLQEKEPALRSQGQTAALAQIGEAIENVRLAWQWAVDHEEFEAIGTAMEPLYRFYEVRSWFQEGESVFARLVELLEQKENYNFLLGRALSRQGRMLVRLTLLDQSQDTLQRALKILRQYDDKIEIAAALSISGVILESNGQYEESRKRQEESLAYFRESGDDRGVAAAYMRLGNVANVMGNYDDAQKYYQESLTLRRRIEDKRGIALCLNNLGSIAETLGRYQEARDLYMESVSIKRDLGDRRGVAYSLNNLGFISCLLENYDEARPFLKESEAIFKEIDHKRGLSFVLTNLGNVAQGLGDFFRAREYYLESLALCTKLGFHFGAAYALNHLGTISCKLNDYEAAKQYYKEALTTAVDINSLPVILEILVEIAAFLALNDRVEDSITTLAFILNSPSSRKQTADKAELLIADLTPKLDGERIGAAKKKAHESELPTLTAFVLNWLG